MRAERNLAIAAVLLVAAISIALTMQGWKSRVIAFDLLPFVYKVRDFLETGSFPEHGDTGSYGSFSPPGPAWLMLPGTLLFSDVRLSEYAGAAFAGSVWPIGRPDFYLWTVFFTGLWVLRRDGIYLAAALGVWGLGMFDDMGITPVFFILPAAWLYYRPPVRIAPLLLVAVVVLAAWSPYLRFEAPRRFVDIRSQLLQKSIFPANYRQA
jgi:hypothetical protein